MAKFSDQGQHVVFPQCNDCQRYNGDGTCRAFRDRIPDPIFLNQVDHREPFQGDDGIRFKPKP